MVVEVANTQADQLCYGEKRFCTHEFEPVHHWHNKLKLCILHDVEYTGGVNEHKDFMTSRPINYQDKITLVPFQNMLYS